MTKMAVYQKKVIVDGKLSTPELRAERLKLLRNLANLTRQELCSSKNLNVNTYKGWELGRFGGLPIDGATKVISRVANNGVICTAEWLLYGKGLPPFVIPEANLRTIDNKKATNELGIIGKEITLLQSYYSNVIFLDIKDDGMAPYFEKGDIVAGLKEFPDNFNYKKEHHNFFIVKTSNNINTIRKVTKDQSGLFTLSCINPNTTASPPVLYNVELAYIAKIIRHYKI